MRTTVVCGLLGSGKTTFIKNSLQEVKEKTVVLVNDFGAAGIDGEIFSADGIEAVELPSGCVCCTLKFDLIKTIQTVIKEFSPEHLVIEPSGIASPSGVLEALECAGIYAFSVIGIVDATEFSELYQSGMYGCFFEDQIRNSDVILVNKTDLAEKEKILETMSLIESINPRAVLFRTVKAELQDNVASLQSARKKFGVKGEASASNMVCRSSTHFHFETLSFKMNGNTKLTQFADFFDALAKGRYGNVVRAKALINSQEGPYRFDSVFGRVDRACFEREVMDCRLVIIGERLDKKAIEQDLFRTE